VTRIRRRACLARDASNQVYAVVRCTAIGCDADTRRLFFLGVDAPVAQLRARVARDTSQVEH
jgi:hypothetical protein